MNGCPQRWQKDRDTSLQMSSDTQVGFGSQLCGCISNIQDSANCSPRTPIIPVFVNMILLETAMRDGFCVTHGGIHTVTAQLSGYTNDCIG